MIKFDGDEDAISVADNVMEVSDFDKYPIMKGDSVNVIVENEEVVFLRKVKGAKKKTTSQETKNDEASVEDTITKEVYCVSQYGLKFVGDKKWTNFSDELQKKDLKSLGVVAKNTVVASISNGKIVDIKVQESKKEDKKEPTVKKSSYRDEEATDKRTASMNAKDIVVALINQQREAVNSKEKIETAISALTKKFYNVTKNL